MGRGTAADQGAGSLLYGPAIARRTGSDDPLRVEAKLRELVARVFGEGAEARAELRDFLRGNEIPRDSSELAGLNSYAIRLEATIEQADRTHFSEYGPGGGLETLVAEADLLAARAGHRIEGSCLTVLLGRRLRMDFFAGLGRDYLKERLGLLMENSGLEHRQGVVILRVEVPGTSHFEDRDKHRPFCMSDREAAGLTFNRSVDPMATASCATCRKYRAAMPEAAPTVTEDLDLQLARLSSELAKPAALSLVGSLRRDARSLSDEEFMALRRRTLWGAFCAHLAAEARMQKSGQQVDLLSPEGRQLTALWDPASSEVPSLPEGLRI